MTYSFLKAPLLLPCKYLLDLDFDMEIIQKKKKNKSVFYSIEAVTYILMLWKQKLKRVRRKLANYNVVLPLLFPDLAT